MRVIALMMLLVACGGAEQASNPVCVFDTHPAVSCTDTDFYTMGYPSKPGGQCRADGCEYGERCAITEADGTHLYGTCK